MTGAQVRSEGEERFWLRARFTKLGKLRFTSHRDVARIWERAVRRARIPVAWSQGFSPRPLLSFGLALPTGCESLAEYLDLRLEAPVDIGKARAALNEAMPEGMEVTALAERDHGAPSLQQEVTSCCWEMEVEGLAREELATQVERFLASPEALLTRVRKGTELREDVRPMVRTLELGGPPPDRPLAASLTAEVGTRPRGLRPPELVAALNPDLTLARARRTRQWIENDGCRREPLPLDGGTAAPPGRRQERVP